MLNRTTLIAAALAVVASITLTGVARAEGLIIGVAWASFQEERWKTDEAAMKAVIEANGDTYISADAQSSNEKQSADIEGLITRGANALIVLAWDSAAVLPGVAKAKAEGIPVVGYDRLIEERAATTPPAVPSLEATTASTLLSLAVNICSMLV